MDKKFITSWFYAPLKKTEYTEETGFWIFREVKKKEQYHYIVDFDKYAAELEKIYTDFDYAGYEVVNVIPMQMAHEKECYQQVGERTNYVGSTSHNMTQGAIVVGKLKEKKD